jgi:hypothetical protein
MATRTLPLETRRELWRQVVAELLRPINDEKKAGGDQPPAEDEVRDVGSVAHSS